MEERKLNFNAPLLSVRRFSATTYSNGVKGKKTENPQLNRRHTLPSYRSESDLDQVTEPVAVPFHWEQIPGRPKDGRKPKPPVLEKISVAPRMCSARVLDVVKQKDHKKSEHKNVNRLLDESNSVVANATKLDKAKEQVRNTSELDAANDDDDDDDDIYSDALDTLSPTGSFSINYSVSGISGSEGLIVKPSGTFSMDPQTRDFMMSRFLPAAKAMTLEPSHHASRKQLVVVEEPKPITKVVPRDRTPPAIRHESMIIPHVGQSMEEEESEDDYDEYDNSHNIRTKACGLIPRLCFKNSLSILNPVPGMKLRTNQASISSTRDVEKPSKAAYSRSQSPVVRKHSRDAVHKQKPDSGVQSPRLLGVESKLTCGSNRFASDRQGMSRTSSPFRRSGGISPYRNEARQSPFRGVGFLGTPKDAGNFNANRLNSSNKVTSKSQELFSHRGTKRGSFSGSLIVEKTLYVDTMNKAEASASNSSSSDIKGYLEYPGMDFKALLKSREVERNVSAEPSFQDIKCVKVQNGEDEAERKDIMFGDSDLLTPSDTSSLSGQAAAAMEDACRESMALVCINADHDQISKEDQGSFDNTSGQPPPPPLLPKTPSESWLWRTLPSVSAHSPFSRIYRGTSFQNKWQDPKSSSANTKWETIVKSSYLHHDHSRYSEELIPHTSQQSKS